MNNLGTNIYKLHDKNIEIVLRLELPAFISSS